MLIGDPIYQRLSKSLYLSSFLVFFVFFFVVFDKVLM